MIFGISPRPSPRPIELCIHPWASESLYRVCGWLDQGGNKSVTLIEMTMEFFFKGEKKSLKYSLCTLED